MVLCEKKEEIIQIVAEWKESKTQLIVVSTEAI
jgi:hypothetical protein